MVSEANEPGSEHATRSPRIVRRSRHGYPDSLLGEPHVGEGLRLPALALRSGRESPSLRPHGASAGRCGRRTPAFKSVAARVTRAVASAALAS